MTEEEEKLVATFEARLRHLVYLHDELRRENSEIKELLKEEKEEKKRLLTHYQELESRYENLKMAKTINLNLGDRKKAKKRLSDLVREIDKCIALLNE